MRLLRAALIASITATDNDLDDDHKGDCALALAGCGEFVRACDLAEKIKKKRAKIWIIREMCRRFSRFLSKENDLDTVDLLLEHNRVASARLFAKSSEGRWWHFLRIYKVTLDARDLSYGYRKLPKQERFPPEHFLGALLDFVRIAKVPEYADKARKLIGNNRFFSQEDHTRKAERLLSLYKITRNEHDLAQIRIELSLVNEQDHHIVALWEKLASQTSDPADMERVISLRSKFQTEEENAQELKVAALFSGNCKGDRIKALAEKLQEISWRISPIPEDSQTGVTA